MFSSGKSQIRSVYDQTTFVYKIRNKSTLSSYASKGALLLNLFIFYMLYVNTEYTVNLYSLLFGPCAWPRNLNIWEYGFDSTLIFGMFQMIGSFACFSSISFHYKCYRLMCLRNHTNLSIYVEHHLNFNRN